MLCGRHTSLLKPLKGGDIQGRPPKGRPRGAQEPSRNGSKIGPIWGPKWIILGPRFGSEIVTRFGTDSDRHSGRLGVRLEALLGTPSAYHEEIHLARPHQGQVHSAKLQRQLLAKSEIRESHRHDDPRVQDAYSLRCVPQVHGAARHALGYVRGILETEANSATDNPLVFPSEELILSGGNFHAQIVSQALDLLAIALADLAAFSERRIERLLNPDLSEGLPAFLARRPGVESGFMIAQVTAVDLLAELRLLAGPASIDSVTTSANQEDHVSMGLAAARKAYRSVQGLERVLAIELMCAAEGIEYRRPLKAGAGVEETWSIVRSYVSRLEGDRMLGPDLETLTDAIGSGALSEVSARYDVRDD